MYRALRVSVGSLLRSDFWRAKHHWYQRWRVPWRVRYVLTNRSVRSKISVAAQQQAEAEIWCEIQSMRVASALFGLQRHTRQLPGANINEQRADEHPDHPEGP